MPAAKLPGNEHDYEAVLDSYHRCEDAGGLFDTFYDLFFAKSPEIPRKFAGTDMEKQKQVVMASLLWMLRLYQGDPIARAEVEKLAESHSRRRHDVRPELYGLWLESLCEAIAQHDPEHTSELEAQWRRVMRPGIELMQSRY
jgi:hemoglobin-like flavoprotein